jgi:hypothetical protein
VAILSLLTALLFNLLQEHNNGRQLEQAKTTNQLQLLTDLNSVLSRSLIDINSNASELRRATQTGRLAAVANAKFEAALKNMDYLAWLLRNRFVPLAKADQLWGRAMYCSYRQAEAVYGAKTSDSVAPELARYASRRRSEMPCPV